MNRLLSWSLSLLVTADCYGIDFPTSADPTHPAATHPSDRLERLGEQIFNDANLSLSGQESCASCHEADRAFTGNANAADPLFPVSTGAYPNLLGLRNTPTAMYMAFTPPFGFALDEGEYVPVGGLFLDGRADSLAEQAEGPFVNPREMAMPSEAAVVERIRRSSYVGLFRSVFGHRAFDDTHVASQSAARAVEAFELTRVFAPFSSKFDAVLRGRARFDAREQHGFELFKDPQKGNCSHVMPGA